MGWDSDFFCAAAHRIFCGLFIHNIVLTTTAFKDNIPLITDKNSFFRPPFVLESMIPPSRRNPIFIHKGDKNSFFVFNLPE